MKCRAGFLLSNDQEAGGWGISMGRNCYGSQMTLPEAMMGPWMFLHASHCFWAPLQPLVTTLQTTQPQSCFPLGRPGTPASSATPACAGLLPDAGFFHIVAFSTTGLAPECPKPAACILRAILGFQQVPEELSEMT